MHTLYWSVGTACLAPQIVLEEIGLPFELVEVQTATGAHHEPAYLAINPLGKVPALRMPDKAIMTEAAAICLYLADTHPDADLSPDLNDQVRGQFLRHLFHLSNTLQETYKRYYYPHRFSTDGGAADGIKATAIAELLDLWRGVDRHLAAHGPLYLGERFSLLDIYTTMMVTWFEPRETLFTECPNVQACFEATSARPAVAKCLAMQGAELSIGTD